MTSDLASLDRLQDIVALPPVPWWPPAPGWFVLGALGLIALGLAGVVQLRRYRANAYRREALRALDGLEARQHWQELPALLKRVALSAYPRTEVAGLSGDAWIAWLNAHGGGATLPPEVAQRLTQAAYNPSSDTDPDGWRQAAASVRKWIQAHSSS